MKHKERFERRGQHVRAACSCGRLKGDWQTDDAEGRRQALAQATRHLGLFGMMRGKK